MDFAYRNITFNMKQLVEVLRCDLQVTIQEGLMETQTELLKTTAGFMDHFQTEMITLSPPQMHALLDHLRARWAGGQAVRCDQTWQYINLSFVDKGPSHLLQSFFDSLPDHQVDIKTGFPIKSTPIHGGFDFQVLMLSLSPVHYMHLGAQPSRSHVHFDRVNFSMSCRISVILFLLFFQLLMSGH